MRIQTIDTEVFGENCSLDLMFFSKEDIVEWKLLFDAWKNLKMGMREYKSREPNFPEGLSEVAFCIWSGSARFIKSRGLSNTSFDTFNKKTGRAEQIKACSIEDDLTSFGPRSKWDDLFFLDFYNGGKTDGRFDVYKIPSDLIYNHQVNRAQTLREQQAQGRRPRLHLKRDIIEKNNIKPLASKIKLWEG